MALSLVASGADLAMCQRCTRRIAGEDGDDGKVAASSETEMGGGDSTKVETANQKEKTGLKGKKRESC